MRKDPPRHPKAPLGSLQSGAFLERLDIDLVTGLPPSEPEGYRYVLTCIDSFTRFVFAFPLKTQEATEIVRILMDQVVCVFGIPKSIHSDKGKNFVGKVASKFYEGLGIHQSTTTAYHPQGNAYCERSHRFLMDAVAKLCRERQRQWPRYLAASILAINANVNESTGLSPYESVFGRPPTLPPDLLYREVSAAAAAPAETAPDVLGYLTGLQETLARTDRLLQEASVEAHGQSKLRHDARIVENVYAAGDRVWLRKQAVKGGEVRKLSSHWEGPYRVVEKLRNWTYKIKKEGGSAESTVHHNRLKPCHSDPEKPRANAPAPPRIQSDRRRSGPTRVVDDRPGPSGVVSGIPRFVQSAVGSLLERLPVEPGEGGAETGDGPARLGQSAVGSPRERLPVRPAAGTETGDHSMHVAREEGSESSEGEKDEGRGDQPVERNPIPTYSRSGRKIRQPIHLRDYVRE